MRRGNWRTGRRDLPRKDPAGPPVQFAPPRTWHGPPRCGRLGPRLRPPACGRPCTPPSSPAAIRGRARPRGRSQAAPAARHSDSGHVRARPAPRVQEATISASPRAGDRRLEVRVLGSWSRAGDVRGGGRLTPGALRPPPVARRQFEDTPPPERVSFEVPSERRKRVKEAKRKEEEAKQAKALEECAWPRPRPGLPGAGPVDGKPTLGRRAGKPNENSDATEDAYKTIFVGRLSFETTESKLRREFGEFGEIKSVRPACRARASASDAAPTPAPDQDRARQGAKAARLCLHRVRE